VTHAESAEAQALLTCHRIALLLADFERDFSPQRRVELPDCLLQPARWRFRARIPQCGLAVQPSEQARARFSKSGRVCQLDDWQEPELFTAAWQTVYGVQFR
jgi:hypothetical protein